MKKFDLYRIFDIDFSDDYDPREDEDFMFKGSMHYTRALFVYEDGAEFICDSSAPFTDFIDIVNESMESFKGKGIDFWANVALRSGVSDYEIAYLDPEVEPDLEVALQTERDLLAKSQEKKRKFEEDLERFKTYGKDKSTQEGTE